MFWQIHAVLCLVAQSCPTLCDPIDCSPPGSSVRGDSPGKNTGVGCRALLQGIFPTQVPCTVDSFFTIWATRDVLSSGVGSLALLQGIFPTQESNQGCLHCRQILHQLSYHESLIHQDSQYVHQGRRWSHALSKSMPALEPPEAITGSVAFTMIRFACLALHINGILQFVFFCVLFL